MGGDPAMPDEQNRPTSGADDHLSGRRNELVIQRISQLLSSAHPETGTVLQGKDVTARARALGQSLSTSYVLGLRSATRGVPSVHVLQLIADIYDVDLNFFTSHRSIEDIRAEKKVHAALDNGDVRMLLRAADLSAAAKENLAAIIEDMLREDPDDAGDGGDGSDDSEAPPPS